MNYERLNDIKQRKKQRFRNNIIKLSIMAAALIMVVVLIVNGIKSATRAIKAAIPTPTPTPVAVIEAPEKSFEYAAIPDTSEANDLLNYIEKSGSQKKVCYLTFDDGPNNSVTPQILDILRRYGIKATFFQVGSLIEANPDMCRRVYEEGHLVANHSYDHTYSKIYADSESFMQEFNACAELIKEITGDDYFPLIRYPGGSQNYGTYGKAKQEYKTVLAQNGMYFCDWNALNGDAEGSRKTPEQLLERIKTSSENKNQIVVLMHDAANKKQTVEALPAILDYLISKGYEFSTLNKLLF